MISYSDYVLAQKPWGYWPLNDNSLTVYNEDHTIIDCSGNEKHLTAKNERITYNVQMPAHLHDSLPLTGVTVSPSEGFNSSSFPSGFLIYGYHSHINDVEPEYTGWGYSHYLWRKRRRIEMLNIGGVVVIGDCVVLPTAAYYKARRYTKYGDDYWLQSTVSYQIASYPAPGTGRIIFDVEWVNDRNLIVSAVTDGVLRVNRSLVTLPEFSTPTLYYRFNDDNWNRIAVLRWNRQ